MLERIIAHLDGQPASTIPPLMDWNPPLTGDMPLVIDHDGQWYHEGSLMTREPLRRLLATLMRREEDGEFYLVTPVEKLRIQVEDTPFYIMDATCRDEGWEVTTDVGDRFLLDDSYCLMLDDPDRPPKMPVRFGLTARVHRNVFYRWVDEAIFRETASLTECGVMSQGIWQCLGRMVDGAS